MKICATKLLTPGLVPPPDPHCTFVLLGPGNLRPCILGDCKERGLVLNKLAFSSFSWVSELSTLYALHSQCTPELWSDLKKAPGFPLGLGTHPTFAMPKCIFKFETESLKMHLSDRWWELITSCVLTEFWIVLKIFIFPPRLWRYVSAV